MTGGGFLTRDDIEWLAGEWASLLASGFNYQTSRSEASAANVEQVVSALGYNETYPAGWVENVVTTLAETFEDIVAIYTAEVQRNVENVVTTNIGLLRREIGAALSLVAESINSAAAAIGNVINILKVNVFDPLQGILRYVTNLVELLPNVFDRLEGLFDTIMTITMHFQILLQELPRQAKVAAQLINETRETAEKLLRNILILLTDLENRLVAAFRTVAKLMELYFSDLRGEMTRFFEELTGKLDVLVSTVAELKDAVQGIVVTISRELNRVIGQLEDRIKGITEVLDNLRIRISETIDSLVNTLLERSRELEQVFNALLQRAQEAAQQVEEALKRFTAGFDPFGILSKLFEAGPKFLDRVVNALARFGEDPLGFVSDVIGAFVEWVKNTVTQIGQVLWDALKDFAEWVWEQIQNVANTVAEWIRKISEAIVSIVRQFFSWLYDTFIKKPAEEFAKAASSELKNAFEDAVKRQQQGEQTGEAFLLFAFASRVLPVFARFVSIPFLLEAAGSLVDEFEASLRPLGIGVRFRSKFFEWVKKAGKYLKDFVSDVFKGFTFGLGWGLLAPLQYIVRPLAKGTFDLAFQSLYGIEAFYELPSVTELRDMLRRYMAKVENFRDLVEGKLPKQFEEVYNKVTKYMEVLGYPREWINYYFDLGKRLSMYVTDRFGNTRLLLLSPLFTVPTHSEAVRMLMRDVFVNPMEWARFVKIYGWSDDLAKMYYMMAFDYPSFRELWKFFVRGITGMLWFVPHPSIQAYFAAEARELGAGEPKPPYELNYKYDALFKAIPFYLKWIQKSNFSWFKRNTTYKIGEAEVTIDFDWTADSWLLWDIAADLPGKIDARWMAKWGLFDLLAPQLGMPKNAATVPETLPAWVDAVTKVVEAEKKSDIFMDLRPFAFLLVANGLHPAWVPITAVAEAINALSEERTLLRTGFINLYKEGFFTMGTLDTLLDGFFTASFAVAWFDIKERKWKGGYINVPVKFLPAERKLLELRAVFDRALDILRDFAREVIRAYTEHIIKDKKEAINKIDKGVKEVDDWFSKQVQIVTGKPLHVTADPLYWNKYAAVMELMREIHVTRRIRYWVGRLLTWSVYRLAYGYVTPRDIDALVSQLVEAGKLTDEEREFLRKVMDQIVGIARREYIPTPSQLATIAEIVPEAARRAKEVFEKRGVPPEWWDIWLRYIEVKPVVDEIRGIVSAYRRAKVYGVDLGNLEQRIRQLLKWAGWTDRELDLLDLRIKLEEMIAEARELRKQYLPTPPMLATLAEYIELPSKLVREVLLKRGVPPEWVDVWIRYITVKPIKSDAKAVLATLLRGLRYGVVKREDVDRFINQLVAAGFTKREIELLRMRVEIEEAIAEAREMRRAFGVSPQTIATLSEYVAVPIELVKKAFEARKIPREWAEVWLKYIRVRPLADEARALATAYFRAKRYGVNLGPLAARIERVLRELGFTDEELKLRELRATVEAMIDAWRELRRMYVPSPLTIARLAEHVPEARRLLEVVVRYRPMPPDVLEVVQKFATVYPYVNEVRRYAFAVIRAYTYGVIDRKELEKIANVLSKVGYEPDEIKTLFAYADVERFRRVMRELIPEMRSLAVMAEYSPTARRFALQRLRKLVDQLPIDRQTKEELIKMWEEYVRIRPVYDEVRRYITELINYYADGLMTIEELDQELKALKKWGLDDYEIEFIKWIAERRLIRRMARRMRF